MKKYIQAFLYIFMEATSCATIACYTHLDVPCRTVYATQGTFICMKSVIEILQKSVEYVHMMSSLFTMGIFHTFLVFLLLT